MGTIVKKKSKKFIALCDKYGVDSNLVPEIMSVDAAFKKLGINHKSVPGVSKIVKRHQKALVDQYKVWILVEALNEGWLPDWTNVNQYKYNAYFYMYKDPKSSSGLGFSDDGCGGWNADTDVGSRLCFKNREIAKFAGKHFGDLFRSVFLIE